VTPDSKKMSQLAVDWLWLPSEPDVSFPQNLIDVLPSGVIPAALQEHLDHASGGVGDAEHFAQDLGFEGEGEGPVVGVFPAP
jgi:hypothetical protein